MGNSKDMTFMIDQIDQRSKQLASILDGAAGRAEELATLLRNAGDKRSLQPRKPPLSRFPLALAILGVFAAGLLTGATLRRER